MFGELDTYALIDFFPFSGEIYLGLFERQNSAFWPLHLLIGLLLLAPLLAAFFSRKTPRATAASRILAVALAASWALVAMTFFLGVYADLNWAAPYFGWVFLAQAGALGVMGLMGKVEIPARAERGRGASVSTTLGLALFLFALLGYPLLSLLSARGLRGAEFIGLAPDPTVIATIGVIAMARTPRLLLLLVPAAWSAAAGLTATALELDMGLLTAVLAASGICVATFARFTGSNVAPEPPA